MNILPTQQNLASWGCVFCGELETVRHALVWCSQAQRFWRLFPFPIFAHATVESDIKEWFQVLAAEMSSSQLEQIMVGLWSLWHTRNLCVWNGQCCSPEESLSCAMRTLHDFQARNALPRPGVMRTKSHWQCPPMGTIKINVDGAF
ncbi:unnamed protein product [Prunus brigantina]